MNTASILVGLCCAQAVLAAPLHPQAPAKPARDTTFLLSTDDPERTPSPFIGNGHLGVVIPALGIGASPSIMAGMFEEAPGDVPRIVAVPAWNAIDVFNGGRWLQANRSRNGRW